MTLTAGSRLGPYEILAPIGAGGMGEVDFIDGLRGTKNDGGTARWPSNAP